MSALVKHRLRFQINNLFLRHTRVSKSTPKKNFFFQKVLMKILECLGQVLLFVSKRCYLKQVLLEFVDILPGIELKLLLLL